MPQLPRTVSTKIVATLGPATESPELIEKLIRAGADVFRLNFAHGEWAWHSEVIQRIRDISTRLDIPVAVLQDLGGPKLRLGELPEEGIQCKVGEHYWLTKTPQGHPNELTCTYAGLVDDLQIDDPVLFADGTVGMRVVAKTDTAAEMQVTLPGELRSKQGVAAPRARLQL
ncbi:MAG TPA: pyruvate kinase, partial [Gemmatales bacterium]|nr:pyruvate kinase [Gemmatales bacterium]